jgi:hypothetical protein
MMTVARSVADVLNDHVVFEIECIDRMYLNVFVPQLRYAAGLVGFVHRQLGLPIASTAPLGKISDAFTAGIRRYARDHGVAMVDFVRGQRKDDVMHEHLASFTAEEGVVFIGRAQEKNSVFRTERRRTAEGRAYPWIVRSTGVINQFYFYCVDVDFGPFFLKFSSYFPYNAKLCINGHEWAKRQATKAGIAFTALDNGFAAVEDPAAVQAIRDRLGPQQIDALPRKWLAILPHPFTAADRAAGYRYDLSILQAEFSLTQMLDKPVSGRVFFEQVIRDNLDAGRPDQVSLIFDRRVVSRGPRATPGQFRTRVLTAGVTPSLHIDYKHTTIKQYHKEGRALRTETTINDTRDFGIGKRLTNLPALREIGISANRRLLGVQRLSHNPIRAAEAFTAINDPLTTDTGTRIPGLRLTDPRTQALLHALLVFRLRCTRRSSGSILSCGPPPGNATSAGSCEHTASYKPHRYSRPNSPDGWVSPRASSAAWNGPRHQCGTWPNSITGRGGCTSPRTCCGSSSPPTPPRHPPPRRRELPWTRWTGTRASVRACADANF